jgi:hypothetical protein
MKNISYQEAKKIISEQCSTTWMRPAEMQGMIGAKVDASGKLPNGDIVEAYIMFGFHMYGRIWEEADLAYLNNPRRFNYQEF